MGSPSYLLSVETATHYLIYLSYIHDVSVKVTLKLAIVLCLIKATAHIVYDAIHICVCVG